MLYLTESTQDILPPTCKQAVLLIHQILEYLIVQLRNGKEEPLEEFSTHKGTLVVSLDIEDSVQHVGQSCCATVISAKGDFYRTVLSDQIQREIKTLLPELPLHESLCGRGCPHELLHVTPFQFSFEFYEKSGVLKEDCLALKQFVHRMSLVHAMIKFHYCVKVNGFVSAETYSTEIRDSKCLPDGTRLLIDQSHFVRPVCTETERSCSKIHPMSGEPVGLFIPSEVAERGFSGDVRLMPVVSLCPCQKQFPNQPVRITALSCKTYIFLYDPAGLPVPLRTTEASHSFFEDPSCLAAWERYGYQAILNSDPYWEEDTARPDVRYELHTSHNQGPECEEQRLLLFLFLSYSDPFQDKPVYNFWDRQVILSHLYPILMFSEQAVRGTIQGVLNRVLEQHHKVAQEQQKLTSSLSIMIEAISTIVSTSTDSEFRRRCLQHLQVADTQQFVAIAKKTFNKVSLQRRRPSSTCDSSKPLPNNDGAEQQTTDCALPFVDQHSSTCVSSGASEQGESCKGEGLLPDRLDFEEMNQMKRRRPTWEELSWEDLRGSNTSRKVATSGKNTGLLAEPGTTLNSSCSHPTKARPDVFPSKSKGGTSALSADRDEYLCQNEDVWNQEVSNLSDWTS
ncbi:type 2 DNA topoisomerase 6 subunit B-like [Sphaerodactylus townsendi]|uniref:type 2 DNA topoisomerase 6 subunit B-like n=1 Tax=Sphaerodactylus townsendi TaxID=933632 RepID=UPI002026218D|nr:type 2 DNA topoisomerase 6 subunit B-like [Sphaerodactylus townsendi]